MNNSTPPAFDLHWLNPNLSGLTPCATFVVNERSNQLIAEGRSVYRWGLGQSPFPVPPSVVQSLKDHADKSDYQAMQGLLPLREAVAKYLQRFNLSYSAADILIGPGSKELLFLTQLSLQAELLLPRPSWVTYRPQAQIIGRSVRWLDTRLEDDWLLSSECLNQTCQQRFDGPGILLLNYPNNPSGSTYSKQALQALADVARKQNLIILSDEIYAEFNFAERHTSIAEFYPEGTIVSTGLSKWCGAGGWRLGVLAFPPGLHELLRKIILVVSESYSSVSAPIQFAAITAYNWGDDIACFVENSRCILKHIASTMVSRLCNMQLKVSPALGAFYLMPDFSNHSAWLNKLGIFTSPQLAARLLDETGIAMLPGTDFGLAENELVFRLAFVDFDGKEALVGLNNWDRSKPLDQGFMQAYCPRLLAGLDRLENWLATSGVNPER